MRPSVVAFVFFNCVECTILQNEGSKFEGNFTLRASKLRATNSQCGSRQCSGRVGVEAGMSTLLLIRFHLKYVLPIQACFVINFDA